MINLLSNTKTLKIPEGYVRSISINSQSVWQSKYINYVHFGTTEPGGNVIYGTEGWLDGYRWSSSGKKVTAETGARVSGWIPFVSGATYRIRNFNGNKTGYMSGIYFVLANEDGSCVTHSMNISNTSIYDVKTDTFTVIMADSNYKYFRISGFKVNANPIITINEPIDNMINFSIQNVPYSTRKGTTWEEWINSEDNDTMLSIMTSDSEKIVVVRGYPVSSSSAAKIYATDLIIQEEKYTYYAGAIGDPVPK